MAREYIRNPRTGNLVLAHSTLGRRIARDLRRDNRQVVFETKEKPNRRNLPPPNEDSEEEEVRAPDRSYTDRLLPGVPSQVDHELEMVLRESRDAYRRSVQKAMEQSVRGEKRREQEKKREASEHRRMQEQDVLSLAREDRERREYVDKNIRQLRMKKLSAKAKPKEKPQETRNEKPKVESLDQTQQRKKRAEAVLRRFEKKK